MASVSTPLTVSRSVTRFAMIPATAPTLHHVSAGPMRPGANGEPIVFIHLEAVREKTAGEYEMALR
jgi:hypothetical protein